MIKRITLKSSLLAAVAGFGFLTTGVYADEIDVQFLGVNDFHGALDTTGTAVMPDGRVSGAGSAALLATYLDDAQADFTAENPDGRSIRVQAGDMVGASPANSGLLQDEPSIKVFNEMDFEYATLGNHEFDEGLAEFNRILTGTAPEAGTFNPIVDSYNREASKQKMVIANVVDKENGQIPFGWEPFAIETITVNDKSVRVGFIGVVTTEIPSLVLRQHHEAYSFLDPAETVAKYSKILEDQGVRAIVVLAHIPSTSKDGIAAGEAADMIARVNELHPDNSVDLVFAGHNHVYTNGLADDNTLIVQATSQGKAYADVRGTLDTDTQDFITVPTAKIVPVAPKVKEPNATVKAIVDEANAIVKTVTEAKIGTAARPEPISRNLNDDKESDAGKLVTTAQLAIAKKAGYAVDFAFTNNGGIRADIAVKDDGSITWGAAQATQPFGNILQIVELTGQQIYDVLNQQYDETEKYFLQMSGLTYTYTDADNPTPEQPYKVVKAYTADGQEIELTKTYTAVINDFLFGGGDSFSVFRGSKLIGAINPDTEVFVEYITDLEKAGQTVAAPHLATKTYVTLETVTSTEALPFTESRTDDATLPQGETVVVTVGQPGRKTLVKEVTRNRAGDIIGERVLSESVDTPAVTQVVRVGSKTATVVPPTPQEPTVAPTAKTEQASLPKTGTAELTSNLLSALGLLTLVGAIKRKRHSL